MEPNPPNWPFLFLALKFKESSLKLRQFYFSTDADKKLMLRYNIHHFEQCVSQPSPVIPFMCMGEYTYTLVLRVRSHLCFKLPLYLTFNAKLSFEKLQYVLLNDLIFFLFSTDAKQF